MPLAADLRPKKLSEFIGQEKLVGDDGPLKTLIENSGKESNNTLPSMVFWGPPGTGKTTLAEIIANETEADFLRISAVIDGKSELKKVIEKARLNHEHNKSTILFIDEIHRWNKAQQDALLPFVESGIIILIGATTENPSFTIISALLSRSKVFIFEQHTEENIKKILKRGIKKLSIKIDDDAVNLLANLGNGDMRSSLNALEIASSLINNSKKKKITKETIQKAVQKTLKYDKSGEEHYNIISAVHKSLRSSNATAATYWIMRMLEAGDDPLYIARRMVRFASEDIGNANPNALLLANIVYDTCHKLGLPECDTALVQLAQYLADSPKDNSAYSAIAQAKQDIKRYGNLEVPLHFRNAPTQLMKDIGYGKDYEYDHNLPGKKSSQQCMPDKLKNRNYFKSK